MTIMGMAASLDMLPLPRSVTAKMTATAVCSNRLSRHQATIITGKSRRCTHAARKLYDKDPQQHYRSCVMVSVRLPVTGDQMVALVETCSENLLFWAEGVHTSEMHITVPPVTSRALRPTCLKMWPSTMRIDAIVPRTITTPTYRHWNTAGFLQWRHCLESL